MAVIIETKSNQRCWYDRKVTLIYITNAGTCRGITEKEYGEAKCTSIFLTKIKNY